LSCPCRCRQGGELLPRHFTLTRRRRPLARPVPGAVCFL
jgi:hypothetical protein